MHRAVALCALGFAVAAALALPAQTASAVAGSNPKPGSLPTCASQAADGGLASEAGGWDKRQVSVQGTDDEAFAGQIRPRNLRVGEPCIGDGDLGVDGDFSIPFQATDTPPEDQTYSEGVGGGYDTVCTDDGTTTCLEYVGFGDLVGATQYICFRVSGSTIIGSIAYAFEYHRISQNDTQTESGSTSMPYGGGFNQCDGFGDHDTLMILNLSSNERVSDTGLRYWAYATSTPGAHASATFELTSGLGPTVGATYGSPMELGGDLGGNAKIVCGTTSTSTTGAEVELETTTYVEQEWVPTVGAGDPPTLGWRNSDTFQTGIVAAHCDYIVSISLTVSYWDADHEKVSELWTWTGDAFTSQVPYTDETPEVEMCRTHPAWQGCGAVLEPDVDCGIDYSDLGNPLTTIGEFFAGVNPFIACLVIPQGWDRAGLLTAAYSHGALGRTVAALDGALPTSLSCGSVGTLPMLDGSTYAMDTCALDIMPTGAKNVIGYVFVLGIAGLALKRVLWALGGDSAPVVIRK